MLCLSTFLEKRGGINELTSKQFGLEALWESSKKLTNRNAYRTSLMKTEARVTHWQATNFRRGSRCGYVSMRCRLVTNIGNLPGAWEARHAELFLLLNPLWRRTFFIIILKLVFCGVGFF